MYVCLYCNQILTCYDNTTNTAVIRSPRHIKNCIKIRWYAVLIQNSFVGSNDHLHNDNMGSVMAAWRQHTQKAAVKLHKIYQNKKYYFQMLIITATTINLVNSLDIQQTALLEQGKTATLFLSLKLHAFTLSFQENAFTFCFQSLQFQLLFI